MKISWAHHVTQEAKVFTCGYCGNSVAPTTGYVGNIPGGMARVRIYICHFCDQPTYFDLQGKQTPSGIIGAQIAGLEKDSSVSKLYDEVRKAAGGGAPTVTVMGCRVILMHVAVDKGVKKNENFEFYVDFLDEKNYIPTGLKDWGHRIRKMGNKANHKIEIMSGDEAKDILRFTEVLLKIIYDMPADLKAKAVPVIGATSS